MGRVVVDDVRDCRVRHTSQLGYLFECRGHISSRERSQTEREYLLMQERWNWAWFWERSQVKYITNPVACQEVQIVD
jgi:hypothetical protein